MQDTNNYATYIGVETTLLQSLKLKIKYTGDVVKDAVVCVGNLVSIAHAVNKNGVLTQELSLGVVKDIGSEPTARAFTPNQYALNPEVANPNYIVIDKSNTYKSDIVTIYVRDIRNIIVGPMADGNFAKGEISGNALPEVSESNLDMYLGRFFRYTGESEFDAGIYYCSDNGWIKMTNRDLIESSPLIDLTVNGSNHDKYYDLKNNIGISPEAIRASTLFNGDTTLAVSTSGLPSVKISKIGSEVKYQIVADLNQYLPIIEGNDNTIYNNIQLLEIKEDLRPGVDSPVSINRYFNSTTNVGADLYHKVTSEGKLMLCYPNIPGINKINIFGSYLL